MIYMLDANIFIQAKNAHYGFDFCPAFWDWLIQENRKGKVFSLDEVYKELKKGADELSQWAEYHKRLFLPKHGSIGKQATSISKWVVGRKPAYTQAAKAEFLNGNADYWLVAQALAGGNIVLVTHEVSALNAKKRIKIPDVCDALKVPYTSPYDMLRNEKACFRL